MVNCTIIINGFTFGLANQQYGSYAPANKSELVRFRPFSLGELMWHLIKQVNDGLLDAYINFFEPRRVKHRRFIPFLVYALFYPSNSINLVTLANRSPWYDSACTHTCSPLLRNPSLS